MNLAEERWVVTKGGDVRTADEDRFVASVFGNGPISQLIAAAPELLRAVKGLQDVLVEIYGDRLNNEEQIKLNALIARAEGRAE